MIIFLSCSNNNKSNRNDILLSVMTGNDCCFYVFEIIVNLCAIWYHLYNLKLTSHGILYYLYSANLSKSFSQLIESIFIFSQYLFSIDFDRCKNVGFTPHCLYRDSLTLKNVKSTYGIMLV